MKELNQQGAYEQYIVQSLIGNYSWSSVTRHGQYFHVGTVRSASFSLKRPLGPRTFADSVPVQIPDKNKNIYCADIRLMVHYSYTHKSFRPLAIYSRRARKPLPQVRPAIWLMPSRAVVIECFLALLPSNLFRT
jgi:hypothetical protein